MGAQLGPLLPTGAVLTGVDALVEPGAARATEPNRMRLRVFRADYSAWPSAPTRTQLGSDDFDDGTATLQVLSVSGLAEAIDRSAEALFVEIRAGNDAGTNADNLRGFRIHFTDPGPRNF